MKQTALHLITLLILALTTLSATAHDFEVDGIYYNINGTEATVTSGTNEYASDVTIPKTVIFGGTTYSVTSIGDYAFYNCSGLTSITIPNSVTAIGEEAFSECSGLTSITIGNSVTSIGEYAFCGCSGLTSITIPNSITSISDGAFMLCTGLTSVTINDSVTYIGSYAFGGCSELINITIPNSVTTIGEYAFRNCTSLTNITIPNSVTSIGRSAFNGCSGLARITIPNSVSSIGEGAFECCSGLTSIFVESGNPNYDSRNNCNAIIETATNTLIAGCMNTIIPNSVTSIGNSAFEGCSRLTSITIPDSVTSIGLHAFYSCSRLTSINIPNSVTSIEYGVFSRCSSLTNITIPNSVTHICGYAFSNCSGLASITIPNSVTSIEYEAFYGCSGMTSVTIPNSVTSIGRSAFNGCTCLTNVTCFAFSPPTINSSSSDAFSSDVTSQATLFVPRESVTAYQAANNWKDFSQIVGINGLDGFEVDGVWYRALEENYAMVIQKQGEDNLYQGDVVIPDSVSYLDYVFSVTAIDASAFEDCYELASVVIGDAVETIGENAFQGCTGLTSVTIGSGVNSIGARAFNYCNALTTVTCRGTVPPVMANANCFSNAAYSRATLVVPRLQIEAYQAADYWYRFSNIEGWGSCGLGDVNADGIIGISDVTALTNALLTNSTDPALLESSPTDTPTRQQTEKENNKYNKNNLQLPL